MILWNPTPVWCPTCQTKQPVNALGRCTICTARPAPATPTKGDQP